MPHVVRLVLLTALMASGPVARADKAEDEAAKLIEAAGGSVVRNPGQPGKPVIGVVLPPKTGNAELKALATFKTLLAVSAHCPFTDATATEVAERKTLVQLVLFDAKGVTDAGLKDIAGLTNLKQLVLIDAAAVTAVGLSHFSLHRNLNQL